MNTATFGVIGGALMVYAIMHGDKWSGGIAFVLSGIFLAASGATI